MKFRTAHINDIPRIREIRLTVKENQLSDPNSISGTDIKHYLTERGKGWVCEIENKVIGFSIVDMDKNNVWALFVDPSYENQGVGKELMNILLKWYFEQTDDTIWLGTGPDTRAEKFYKKQGWIQNGLHGTDEIKFEMTKAVWASRAT